MSGILRFWRSESSASIRHSVWSPGFSRLRVDFAKASKHFEICEQAPSHRLKPGLQASELRRPSGFVIRHSSFVIPLVLLLALRPAPGLASDHLAEIRQRGELLW